MKEIGGYFQMEEYHGNEFHEGAIALNSARNCLRYLIRENNITKIYIPIYNCSAVVDALNKENISYSKYHLNKNFGLPINLKPKQNEWVYIVNYFGQFSEKDIIYLKNLYPNLIIDNVQAFFEKPVAKIDTIYTCRKFFGVCDGAYLYTKVKSKKCLEKDHSTLNNIHPVLGRYEQDANMFFEDFHKSEDYLDNADVMLMSNITKNILKSIDYKTVAQKRILNFDCLMKRLQNYNELKNIRNNSGPYMYPLLIQNGSHVREKLKAHKIYIPLLWPNVLLENCENSYEFYVANNLLPIPCDQRYSIEDMNFIADSVKLYM